MVGTVYIYREQYYCTRHGYQPVTCLICGCALKIIDAETDLDLLANSASTIVTHVVEDTTKSIICHIAPTTGLDSRGPGHRRN